MLLEGWFAEDVVYLEPWLGALVGALAQALLVLKGASNLYSCIAISRSLLWWTQLESNKTSPPYSFVNIYFFWKKTIWVNAECRDASKNTLRTLHGLIHKKSIFCMRFSVKSVSIGKLYFAIWSGSIHRIQTPYNLADRFKIHPIVRFDTWNILVHHSDPISGGCVVKPSVQKAHNKWSVVCAIGENCRGVWRAGQKLRSRPIDWHFPFKPPP